MKVFLITCRILFVSEAFKVTFEISQLPDSSLFPVHIGDMRSTRSYAIDPHIRLSPNDPLSKDQPLWRIRRGDKRCD